MRQNRAEGREIRDLDIVVVDDSKPLQGIVRSILSAARVARIRVFDKAEDAHRSMLVEPPHVVLTDFDMPEVDGLTLVRTMRDPRSGPLTAIPVILAADLPTRLLVERAIGLGIHYVLAKPLSPANVMKRIEAVTRDERRFVLDEENGHWVLEDRDALLVGQRERWRDLQAGSRVFPVRGVPETTARRRVEPAASEIVVPVEIGRPEMPATAAGASRCRSFGLAGEKRRGSVETSTGQPTRRTA